MHFAKKGPVQTAKTILNTPRVFSRNFSPETCSSLHFFRQKYLQPTLTFPDFLIESATKNSSTSTATKEKGK